MKCLKVFGIVFLSVATAIMCSSCRGAQKETFIEDFTGELDKDKRPLDYVNEMLTVKGNESSEEETTKRALPGSIAFTPSVAGLILASEVIKDLTGVRND